MSTNADNPGSPRSHTHLGLDERLEMAKAIVRTPAELGATIRDRRRRLRWGQRDLADKVGVSRQWIIEAEKGKPGAEIGLVLRALAALNITLRATDDWPLTAKKPPAGTADIDAIIARARRRGK